MSGARGKSLTEGPVSGHLIRLALPMFWGILCAVSYNVADIYFVGQLGPRELAAISFTFPAVMVAINLSVGLGAGISSVLARSVGAGDWAAARRLTVDSLYLAVLVSTLFGLVGLFTIDALFLAMGAAPDLLPDIRAFMLVWYPGVIFLVVSFVCSAALRAIGETRLQGYLMVGVSLLNIALDPILIFGLFGFPRLEVAGAAVATVAARALLCAVMIWELGHRHGLLAVERPAAGEIWRSWRRILHVGLPATATNMIIPMALGVVVAMVARHGEAAVAGFGVAIRIEGVTLVAFYALSSVIGPVAGQNLGAGKEARVREALAASTRFCLWFGLLMAVALALVATPLVGLFSEEPQVLEVARLYLWIVPLSYGGAGAVMVYNAAFNGLGQPGRGVIISGLRMIGLYLPLGLAGSLLFGVEGIFVAGGLANIAAGLFGYLWIRQRFAAGSTP